MTVLALAPAGFYQMYYAIAYGVWYARSPDITTSPFIKLVNVVRIAPDMVFGAGGVLLFVFIVRAVILSFARSREVVRQTQRRRA